VRCPRDPFKFLTGVRDEDTFDIERVEHKRAEGRLEIGTGRPLDHLADEQVADIGVREAHANPEKRRRVRAPQHLLDGPRDVICRDRGVILRKLTVVAKARSVLQQVAEGVGRAVDRRVEREMPLLDKPQGRGGQHCFPKTPPRNQRLRPGRVIRIRADCPQPLTANL
jgi:Flp pilus assembly CpaF family ATPase